MCAAALAARSAPKGRRLSSASTPRSSVLARIAARLRVALALEPPGVEKLRFATAAEGFFMAAPRTVHNPERIHLGKDVKLGPNSVLRASLRYPDGNWMRHPEGQHVQQEFDPIIRIGDRVTATANLQVIAYQSVVIEDDVLFAANVYVSDGTHSVARADVPYKYQGLDPVAGIRIGRGSWIGQNVVLVPGVDIGEYCVIGSNSVVTRSVPDRSIAVGSPARVIKRWSDESGGWVDA